jgi:hypothetical protein
VCGTLGLLNLGSLISLPVGTSSWHHAALSARLPPDALSRICCFNPCRPRTATIGSRQHGCLHPVVSTMQGGANQACRALVNKRACKW